MPVAWLRVLARRTDTVQGLVGALLAAGLVEEREGPEPGVVVADGASDELLATLAGGGRVLVAVTGEDLSPWWLLEAGAADVLRAPGADAREVLVRLERWAAVEALVDSAEVRSMAVGASPRWRDLLRDVVEIARFTHSPVLLTGETGTGKEVVARLVDRLDSRSGKPELQLVDCTTVVPTLLGSELFGHEKGAFTGASGARLGAFALADGGTLLLDEVGELPTDLQPALLRVVQEGTYKAVGGTRWHRARFRLVAATNRDLLAEAEAGRFRRDLYYRLAAATVRVPPLRERPEDIVPLFRHFLAAARPGEPAPGITPEVAAVVTDRDYPGNVRDLRQLAVRVAARHVGDGPVTPGDLPPDDRPAVGAVPTTRARGWADDLAVAVRGALVAGVGLRRLKETTAALATEVALAEGGGAAGAARLLGVSRRAVDYRTAGGRDGAAPEGGGPPAAPGQRGADSSPASS
ncbi:sigma 54-interacting transcriptional regulator [Georgenia sp. SYP-B2076]|uniref:sigma 54-interacting transcriptional regulator n=1 Tax=Georgenia sp. SYP-B2076 TaxID=2495881 RepID=UPI000F8DA537|nr:sigma 54-interacting transcriptional regulator [Georgenia sp. SYP-B2076]